MNLKTLTDRAANGEVRELELFSLEGGFYLARVRLDQGHFTIMDDLAKPMHFRSITHLRDLLHLAPPFPCVLVQQCSDDEMCGSNESSIESSRTPFSLTAPW